MFAYIYICIYDGLIENISIYLSIYVLQLILLSFYFHLSDSLGLPLHFLINHDVQESTFSLEMVAEPLPVGKVPVERPPKRVRGPSGKPGRRPTPEEVAKRRAKRKIFPIYKDPLKKKREARKLKLKAKEERTREVVGRLFKDR